MNARTAPMAVGTLIEGLQVERLLGHGRSGPTYLVVDPQLGTRFVLKEYRPDAPLDAAVFAAGLELFLQRARAVAAAPHPGLARVLRLINANDTACVLMQWQEGTTLAQRLEGGKTLEPEAVRPLILGLADALACLHEAGWVHMDVKPANILLREDGAPVLLDFDALTPRGDRHAARSGSPGYAAPEQSDASGTLGPWTDAYGLAATLYRCLSGKVPPSAQQRVEAVAAGEADPLPALQGARPDTQLGALADALGQGLRLDPTERPQDLRVWRQGFESLDWRLHYVMHGGTGERERRPWLPFAFLGLLLALMLAGGLYLLRDPQPAEDAVETPTVQELPDPATVSEAEQGRWQAALDADTVFGYRRFMTDYPQSMYFSQAQVQIDLLDDRAWQELSAEDSRPAYADYLERFPNGRHQAEAMARIEALDLAAAQAERERAERERLEAQAWQSAQQTGTVAALDAYLGQWPSGSHAEEAQDLRRRLQDRANDDQAWAAAQRLGHREALQGYIDAFPQGAHVTAALTAMDQATLRPGKRFRDCADCPEMMVLPAGTFEQGAAADATDAVPAEQPARQVAISAPFALGVYEVTLAQWDACHAAGGCPRALPDNGWGRGQRPAIMLSWEDAQQYIAWLSASTGKPYRLPSESEWEYAARAGETGVWMGGAPAEVCRFANLAGSETSFEWRHPDCGDTLALGTAPAGTFEANDFGLYDMIGNVAEWTADCWNLSYLDAPADGSEWTRGICSSHPTRGGSWVTGSREVRLPARFNLRAGDRNDFTGFRVARDIEETEN